MSTMNISLPDSLKAFVEGKVQSGAYSTNSEFIKVLLRKEQDRDNLQALLMQGISSGRSEVVN